MIGNQTFFRVFSPWLFMECAWLVCFVPGFFSYQEAAKKHKKPHLVVHSGLEYADAWEAPWDFLKQVVSGMA